MSCNALLACFMLSSAQVLEQNHWQGVKKTSPLTLSDPLLRPGVPVLLKDWASAQVTTERRGLKCAARRDLRKALI